MLRDELEATGVLAKILNPQVSSTVDFGQKRLDTKVSLAVLGLKLLDSKFGIKVSDKVAIEAGAKVHILVGTLDADLAADAGSRGLRWKAHGGADITVGIPISSAEIWLNQFRLKCKLKMLGVPLTVCVPGIDELNADLLWDLFSSLFKFDLSVLKNILSGNFTISLGKSGGGGDGTSDSSSDGYDDGGEGKGENAEGSEGSSGQSSTTSHQPGEKTGSETSPVKETAPGTGPGPQPVAKEGPAPKPESKPPVQSGKYGPPEKGEPVYLSAGAQKQPGFPDASYVLENVTDQGDKVYTWAQTGNAADKCAWRIAVIGHDAFLFPFYFTPAAADADAALPMQLPAGATQHLPNNDEKPTELARALIKELLRLFLPSGLGGEGGGSLASSNRAELIKALQSKLTVFALQGEESGPYA